MSIEMPIEMSAENPISDIQRYFWRKWRKITENRPRAYALTIKMEQHYRKIENSRKSKFREFPRSCLQKKRLFLKHKCYVLQFVI